jgi:NADH dehydrogenase [ubiquinone] 1 alpha subcomplex assembly factor 7
MLGLWFVTQIPAIASARGSFNLIEWGPGRGTLLADMLRTWSRFPAIMHKLNDVHLIEASSYLRQAQLDALGKVLAPTHTIQTAPVRNKFDQLVQAQFAAKADNRPLQVHWHESALLADIPSHPFMMVAHEFFDALPIDQYQVCPAHHS